MSEMTPEKLRELPGTPTVPSSVLDAFASAWEADRAMRADGLCLVHGLYSVDEDNPEGDCKVCRIQSCIEALRNRVAAKQNIIKSVRRIVNDHLDAEAALAAKEET